MKISREIESAKAESREMFGLFWDSRFYILISISLYLHFQPKSFLSDGEKARRKPLNFVKLSHFKNFEQRHYTLSLFSTWLIRGLSDADLVEKRYDPTTAMAKRQYEVWRGNNVICFNSLSFLFFFLLRFSVILFHIICVLRLYKYISNIMHFYLSAFSYIFFYFEKI